MKVETKIQWTPIKTREWTPSPPRPKAGSKILVKYNWFYHQDPNKKLKSMHGIIYMKKEGFIQLLYDLGRYKGYEITHWRYI